MIVLVRLTDEKDGTYALKIGRNLNRERVRSILQKKMPQSLYELIRHSQIIKPVNPKDRKRIEDAACFYISESHISEKLY